MAETHAVGQGQLLLFDEDEPGLHALNVHGRIGSCEYTRLAVGQSDLREMVLIGEQADGERLSLGLRQLSPAQPQSSGNAFKTVEHAPFGQRPQSNGIAGQLADHILRGVQGRAERIAEGGIGRAGVNVIAPQTSQGFVHPAHKAIQHIPVRARLIR